MVIKLTPVQEDALREVGNIGSGNAATALAQFLNKKINMDVPSVSILPIEKIPEILGEPEDLIASVFLKVLGEAPGNIILLTTEESMYHFLTLVFDGRQIKKIGHLERSALQEMGNIIAGSFLCALNKLTSFNCVQSLPGFALDMAGAILNSIAALQGQYGEDALFLETRFTEGKKEILSKFFLVPDTGSLEKILMAIGVESDGQGNTCRNGGTGNILPPG